MIWTSWLGEILSMSAAVGAPKAVPTPNSAQQPSIVPARPRVGRRISGDGGPLPAGCVLVVDEAGMVPTRVLSEMVEHVERARAKLVLVGDDRQLPEIGAGGAFRALTVRLPVIELRA